MDRNGAGQGQSTTYGLACMACFKAKCRCVPRPSGGSCERCFRLRKDCQPSDSARRRIAQRAQESDTRIAQLEGKIESLLSAMQSVVSASGSSANVHRLLGDESLSLSTASSVRTPSTSGSTNPSIAGGPIAATDLSPAAPLCSTPAAAPRNTLAPLDISPHEAEECLNLFRSRMLPCFPLVHLPPRLTAWELRRDRPFLFQAIVTVTSFSTQTKLARAEHLKRLITAAAILEAQSNIDILLGLLTYITWSTDGFLGRADLLSRLMMLAISLVYDMRLNKPSPPDLTIMMTLTQGFSRDNQDTNDSVQSFMERHRAVLACFVLSSNLASHFSRIDALRWTPQMGEALRIVGMNKSCPTDEALVFHVRLQLLIQKAAEIREQQEADRSRASAHAAPVTVPSILYLKTLRAELLDLRASLSPGFHHRDILDMYTQYAELYIYQTAFSINTDAPEIALPGQFGGSGQVPGFERLECQWQSVEAIRSWLDIFQTVPLADCVGLPFHFWSQTIRCTVILKHLSTMEDPAWDCRAVRTRVDLSLVLDWVSAKFERLSGETGLDIDDDLFKLLSKLLTRSRAWMESKMLLVAQKRDAVTGDWIAEPDITGGRYPSILDEMVWMESMNLESDQWFETMLHWSPDEL
ncbi:hypothetical protein GQ53DRAFT_707560 [Thozetella sp. PMI_491]|nr:hypothetical protein GQ53DRAFT_707560 [Thozetella sp. PMI_491]